MSILCDLILTNTLAAVQRQSISFHFISFHFISFISFHFIYYFTGQKQSQTQQ